MSGVNLLGRLCLFIRVVRYCFRECFKTIKVERYLSLEGRLLCRLRSR